jgi:hypothetical protein
VGKAKCYRRAGGHQKSVLKIKNPKAPAATRRSRHLRAFFF